MRKLAYCPNCKRHRKLTITIISFKHFTPMDCEYSAIYVDADYEDIVCFACGSAVELPQDESDKIIKAAYKAEGY